MNPNLFSRSKTIFQNFKYRFSQLRNESTPVDSNWITRLTQSESFHSLRKGKFLGFGFMLGMFGTGVMAVDVPVIKTWSPNEKLSANDLNTAFTSLRTPIVNIPDWTKNGTNAYYTAGNVGIGTTTPFSDSTANRKQLSFGGNGAIWVNNDSSNPFGIDTIPGKLRLFAGTVSSTYQVQIGNMASSNVFTPYLTVGDGTSNRGNVGIGTSSPYRNLHLFGSNSPEILIEDGAVAESTPGRTWRIRSDSTALRFIRDSSTLSSGANVLNMFANGNVQIWNSLSKGSGTFDIPHPDPSMPKDSHLRHSFVESPTSGDNIYRWQVKVSKSNTKYSVKLPKYWKHLNTNPMVWISSVDHSSSAYATVNLERDKIEVHTDKLGTFNVLLIGTRKDSIAVNNWKNLGMEYIAKGIGEAEKILSFENNSEILEETLVCDFPKSIEKEVDTLKKEITGLSLRLGSVTEENKELKKQLTELKKENTDFKQSVMHQLKEMQDLRYAKK